MSLPETSLKHLTDVHVAIRFAGFRGPPISYAAALQALFGTLTWDVVVLTMLYSTAGLGIAIVNDFKSIEGDRRVPARQHAPGCQLRLLCPPLHCADCLLRPLH